MPSRAMANYTKLEDWPDHGFINFLGEQIKGTSIAKNTTTRYISSTNTKGC